jgi:hypothetical protein
MGRIHPSSNDQTTIPRLVQRQMFCRGALTLLRARFLGVA